MNGTESAAERAKALFYQGYNCSQAVAGAFAEQMGLPLDTVTQMVSALGGGMCRMRETCGAVSGAMIVLGTLRGYHDPTAKDQKAKLYAEGQQLCRQFQKRFGSLTCGRLLGIEPGSSDAQPTPRTSEFYQTRPCPHLIEGMAEILESYLAK